MPRPPRRCPRSSTRNCNDQAILCHFTPCYLYHEGVEGFADPLARAHAHGAAARRGAFTVSGLDRYVRINTTLAATARPLIQGVDEPLATDVSDAPPAAPIFLSQPPRVPRAALAMSPSSRLFSSLLPPTQKARMSNYNSVPPPRGGGHDCSCAEEVLIANPPRKDPVLTRAGTVRARLVVPPEACPRLRLANIPSC